MSDEIIKQISEVAAKMSPADDPKRVETIDFRLDDFVGRFESDIVQNGEFTVRLGLKNKQQQYFIREFKKVDLLSNAVQLRRGVVERVWRRISLASSSSQRPRYGSNNYYSVRKFK